LRLVRVLRGGFTHRFRDRMGVFHLSRTAPWDALADERWQGYMNGAVESGRRAARELMELRR
jgi:hypothetical protein